MTKEDKLYLSSFEKNFDTAINHSWSSAVPVKDIKRMIEIVKEYEPKYTANINCSSCVLGLLKKLGQIYFDEIKEVEGTEPKEENQTTVPSNEVIPNSVEEVVSKKVRKTTKKK